MGWAYAWMAEQAERISQQQQSQGNALGAGVASFAADLNRAGAGFDLLYAQSQSVKAGVQQTWRDVQLVRQNGLVAGGKQALKEHATMVGQALPVAGNIMRGNEARGRGDYLSATGYYMGAGGEGILLGLAIRTVASSPKTSGGTPPVIATDPTPAPTQAAMGDGFVYRSGPNTPRNLTPRPGLDPTGLSTFSSMEAMEAELGPVRKAQVIEVSRLRTVEAVPDVAPEGHVTIRPIGGGPNAVADWASARELATPHPFTAELQLSIVKEVRGTTAGKL